MKMDQKMENFEKIGPQSNLQFWENGHSDFRENWLKIIKFCEDLMIFGQKRSTFFGHKNRTLKINPSILILRKKER